MSGTAAQSSKVSASGAKSRYEKYIKPCEVKSTETVPNINELVLENIGKSSVVAAGDKGGKRLLFKYKDPKTGKINSRILFKLRCQLAGTFWYNDGTKVFTKSDDKKDSGKGKAKPKTEDTQEEPVSGKKAYTISVDSFVDAIPESSEEMSDADKAAMMDAFNQMTSQQCGITEEHRDVVEDLNSLYNQVANIVTDTIDNDDPAFVSSFMPDRPWGAMPHFLKYPIDGKIKGAPNLEKMPTGWKIKVPHYDVGTAKRTNIFDLSGNQIRNWSILGGCRVLFDVVLSLENIFSSGQTAYIQLLASEITILNSEKRVYEPLNRRAINLATDETKGVQKTKLEELKAMAEERRKKAQASKDNKKLEEEASAILGTSAPLSGAKLKVPAKTEEAPAEEAPTEETPSEDLEQSHDEPEEVQKPPVKPPAKTVAAAPKVAPKAGAKKSATFTRAAPS